MCTVMLSSRALDKNKKPPQELGLPAPCALWKVDLKLTHVDCNPEATLVHFQGQYLTISELDYNILQVELQNAQKTRGLVEVGEFCLVEDVLSDRWYRGRVQNKRKDLFDVFLIDHGNVLTVNAMHLALGSDELFLLAPKVVCGFFANMLPLKEVWDTPSEKYFSSLIGSNVKGYILALLPHKVLILEAPDINTNLKQMGFGRHVDMDTFLLLVEMLMEVPLKQSSEPVPDLLIEKPNGQEFFFKPSSLQGFEDILSFCSPMLTAGQKVKVRITAAVSPGTFYCQMTSMEKDLQVMSEKLAEKCEYKSKDSSQTALENLGLLCSAKGKDERWHRGLVQFLPVNSQVRVLFVDYGFCESVKIENVLQLPTGFLSTPIMAFPCAFSCLAKEDQIVKAEQQSLLKKGLLGGILEAQIDSFDEEKNLYSVTMFCADDKTITQTEPVQDVTDPKKSEWVESELTYPQNSYLYYKGTVIQLWDDSIQAQEITMDSVFEGYVEHILNPSQFWLRTQKRNCDFEKMMKSLGEHFSQIQLDEEILENPEPGAICCAMYEKDMHYYRAIVTDILERGAKVFFIDFGNTENVPNTLLKKIPETLASEPAFAFCCSLVNVMPVDDDLWMLTATENFRRAVSNKPLLVHVFHICKDRFVVDLYEIGGQMNKSMSELLIKTNQAAYLKYPPSKPAIPKVIPEQQNGKPKLINKKPLQRKKSNQGVLAKNQVTVATDERDLCDKTEITSTNTTSRKNPTVVFKALMLRPGNEIAVCCSHIESPSGFWCQLQSKIPLLDRLMEELQQFYPTYTAPVQSGYSCCMANYPGDGKWYRACIIGAQKDNIEMFFVDYGMTVRLNVNNLRAILPEHLKLDGQAFRCSLYNFIEPVDNDCGKWSPEACDLLKVFVQDLSPNLKCSIRSQLFLENKGLCNVVDLHNSHHSAAEMLVKRGLARKVEFSAQLAPSVVPYSFPYSSFGLNSGNVEQIYVTHVVSPWEIFGQLDRNTDIMEELMEKVSKGSEKILSDKTGDMIGKLCLSKYFGDGRWYRGVVCPVPQSNLHLNVFFVDYGNSHIVEKSNVMTIPCESTDLLFTPMQALRFSLARIPKEDNFAMVHLWLEKSVLNRPLQAVVVGKTEDGTVDIDLFDGDIHINEKLKQIIASQAPKSENKVVHLDTNSPQKKQDEKPSKTPTKGDVCHKRQLQKKQSPKYSIPTYKNFSGTQQKQQNEAWSRLKFENSPRKDKHDPNSPSKQPAYTIELPQLASLPTNNITKGLKALGFVSHLNKMSSFFIQMQQDEQAILKMGEDLNSDVINDTMKNNTSVKIRVNDLLVAKYEEDGALYRAVVKDFEPNYQYRVEFVDYGNTAVVKKENTYFMTSAWLSLPRLSIHCTLVDASCYDSVTNFAEAVMGRPLMVEFVSRFGAQWEVNIEIQGQEDTLALRVEADSSKLTESQHTLVPSNVTKKDTKPSNTKVKSLMFPAKVEEMVPKISSKASTNKNSSKTYKHHHNRRATQLCDTPKNPSPPVRICLEQLFEPKKNVVIPLQSIEPGQAEKGTLLSVLENGNLFVKINRSSVELESLIAENLSRCQVTFEEDVKIGLHCLTRSSQDSQWCRAIVQSISTNRGRCKVYFVDHGSTEEVPLGDMRELCDNLRQIPMQAVLCKWADPGLPLAEKAYEILKNILRSVVGKEIKLMFESYSEADNLWMVEILMSDMFLLHQEKLQTPQPAEKELQIYSKTDGQGVLEGDSISDSNPFQRLCVAPINMDQTYSGFAAAVTTPWDFYIILEDLLPNMNTVSTILDDLPAELPLPLPEDYLTPRTCCLVRCDTKNKWCRAEVEHADKTSMVVINLVDYGHCVDIPYQQHSKLRRLPEQLTQLPKVTYPCALRGVKPAGDYQWTDEAVVFFQERISQRNLEIHFRQEVSEEHWVVDLVMDGAHIAKELVDAGHATYIDVMLGLCFQKPSPAKAPLRLRQTEDKVHSTWTNKLPSRLDGSEGIEDPLSGIRKTPKIESQPTTPTESLKDDQAERIELPSFICEERRCALM